MSSIFEIKDKDGKIVRRGYVPIGSTELTTEPGDYYYRIIDINKDEIISEGRIYNSIAYKEKEEAFFLYAQAMQNLKFYCPLWKKGYDVLVVEEKDTGKIVSESILRSTEGQIVLDPGKYRAYVKRSVDELRSSYKDFSVFEESREDFNLTVSLLLGKDFKLGEGNVFKAMDQIEDGREKSVVDFLMARRSLSLLSKKIGIEKNVHTKILSDIPLNIIFYEYEDGNWVYKGVVNTDPGEILLEGEDKKRYRARVMNGEDLLCEVPYFVDSSLRDDLMREQEEKSKIKERMSVYDSLEDSDLAKLNRLTSPLFELSDAPVMEFEEDMVHVRIDNWEYYKRIPGGAYLIIRPRNKFYSKAEECIAPIKESLSLDRTRLGLTSEEYVSWIEDAKRRRISHMTSSSTEDGVKRSVIKRRAKVFDRYATVRLLGAPSYIKEIYASMAEAEDIVLSDMIMVLAKKMMKPNDLATFNNHMQVVLDAHLESFGIADEILKHPVIIDRTYQDIILKKGDAPYMVEIVEIPIEGEPSRSIQTITDSRTIMTKEACYYIVCPISTEGDEYLLRGGYVLLNTLKNNSLAVSSKIHLEVRP